MTISYRAGYAVAALLLFTGYASRQEAQLPQLRSEVGHLNQCLENLTNQAAALVAQTGKPLTADALSQPISLPASLLQRTEATIEHADVRPDARAGGVYPAA